MRIIHTLNVINDDLVTHIPMNARRFTGIYLPDQTILIEEAAIIQADSSLAAEDRPRWSVWTS